MALHNEIHHLVLVEGMKGWFERTEFPEDNAKGVDIHLFVKDGIASSHLWGHVSKTTDNTRERLLVVLEFVSQAQVKELSSPSSVETHVTWLDVAVHDLVLMHVQNGLGHIERNWKPLLHEPNASMLTILLLVMAIVLESQQRIFLAPILHAI